MVFRSDAITGGEADPPLTKRSDNPLRGGRGISSISTSFTVSPGRTQGPGAAVLLLASMKNDRSCAREHLPCRDRIRETVKAGQHSVKAGPGSTSAVRGAVAESQQHAIRNLGDVTQAGVRAARSPKTNAGNLRQPITRYWVDITTPSTSTVLFGRALRVSLV